MNEHIIMENGRRLPLCGLCGEVPPAAPAERRGLPAAPEAENRSDK